MARYLALFIPHGDGGYTVEVPTLPGCVTEGKTFEQALAHVREAATGWLETAALRDMEIPVEPVGTFAVPIDIGAAPAMPVETAGMKDA